jgi:hypothetical protein
MPTSHLGSRCMSKHITQSKSRLFFEDDPFAPCPLFAQ